VSEHSHFLQDLAQCDLASRDDALALALHEDGRVGHSPMAPAAPHTVPIPQRVHRTPSLRSARARISATSLSSPSHVAALPVPSTAITAVSPLGGAAKRGLDIVIAAAALILFSPLLAIVALLIRVTMGRPIIFSHERVGHGGQTFACLKFRTMVNDSDAALKDHLLSNSAAREEWQLDRKLNCDPRVTRLGSILRRSSIDELPQLFNVLLGQMSCVGPRPIVKDEAERYGKVLPDYLRTRPGMTGLWQVSGRNRLSYRTRVALDRCYVRRWSLARDLWILLKTIPAVVRSDETA